MYLIPTLDTKEEVLTVIDKIQNCGESGAAGNHCNLFLLKYLIKH
jgi:hypothetical protein